MAYNEVCHKKFLLENNTIGDVQNPEKIKQLKKCRKIQITSTNLNTTEAKEATGDANDVRKTKTKKYRKQDDSSIEVTKSSERKMKSILTSSKGSQEKTSKMILPQSVVKHLSSIMDSKMRKKSSTKTVIKPPSISSCKYSTETLTENDTPSLRRKQKKLQYPIQRKETQVNMVNGKSITDSKMKKKSSTKTTDIKPKSASSCKYSMETLTDNESSTLRVKKKFHYSLQSKEMQVNMVSGKSITDSKMKKKSSDIKPKSATSSRFNMDTLTDNDTSSSARKKKKFHYSLQSKEIQVNTLSGKSARVISAISMTKYRNNPSWPKPKMSNIFNSVSKRARSKYPCDTNLDTIDIIEEIPLHSNSNLREPSMHSIKLERLEPISNKVNKACVQYSRVGQRALSVLNNKVSAVLRNSLCNIDSIQMRIRRTVDEINECDKVYKHIKGHPLVAQSSFSTVSFTNSNSEWCNKSKHQNTLVEENTDFQGSLIVLSSDYDDVLDSISTSHIQTNNQFINSQVPPISETEPLTLSDVSIVSEAPPIHNPPKENFYNHTYTVYRQTSQASHINFPQNTSSSNMRRPQTRSNLTAVKSHIQSQSQQGYDVINFPQYISCNNMQYARSSLPAEKSNINFQSQPLQDSKLYTLNMNVNNAEPPPTPIKELSRFRGYENLHNQLVKEFQATDSLVQFQQQIQEIKYKDKDRESDKDKVRHRAVEIMAEELYIPEKKINKIQATNLNTSTSKSFDSRSKPRTCQFLYREKTKLKDQPLVVRMRCTKPSKTNVQEKYPDSVLFSSRTKKGTRQEHNSLSVINSSTTISQCNILHRCDSCTTNRYAPTKSYMQSEPHKTGLNCFDILDEITLNDLKPFDTEYPRKDHIGAKPRNPPVENTLLYKLMYGPCKNHFLDLLSYQEPSVHCSSADCKTCSKTLRTVDKSTNLYEQKRATVVQKIEVKNFAGGEKDHVQRKEKKKGTKRTKKSVSCSSKDSCPTTQNSSNLLSTINKRINSKSRQTSSENKKVKKFANDDIARKLRPYIFDPRMRYPTTITVMPVMVTTYTNPNVIQANKKNQSGDFSSTSNNKQCLNNKNEPKEKSVKHFYKPITPDKKQWINKDSKPSSYNLINPQLHGDTWEETNIKSGKRVQSVAASTKIQKRTHTPCEPYMQQAVSKTPRTFTSTKAIKKPANSQSMLHKHAAESCKLLKDIQILSQKTKLETSIQSVIDMIENKIVDILSSPEESHSDAFKIVEAKIVEILNTIQAQNAKPLSAIEEGSDSKGDLDSEGKVKHKKKFSSKTGYYLSKPVTSHNEPLKLPARKLSPPSNLECKSSNEEKFEVTSACAPKHVDLNRSAQSSLADETTVSKDITEDSASLKFTVPLRDHSTKSSIRKIFKSVVKPNAETTKTPKMNDKVVTTKQVDSESPPNVQIEDVPSPPSNNEQVPPEPLQMDSASQSTASNEKTIVENTVEVMESTKDVVVVKTERPLSPANMQVVTRKPSLGQVKSDEFLTPFMQALTRYRRQNDQDSSVNVIEFLDNLTSVANDDSIIFPTSFKHAEFKVKTIYYNHKIHIAHVFYQPQIFYPIDISYSTKTLDIFNKDLKVLFHCEWFNKIPSTMTMINEFKSAVQSYTPLNFNNLLTYEDTIPANNQEVICCRVDTIIPTIDLPRNLDLEQVTDIKRDDADTEIYDVCRDVCTTDIVRYEHRSFLNTIYGVLFIAVFFSLTFNYSCQ